MNKKISTRTTFSSLEKQNTSTTNNINNYINNKNNTSKSKSNNMLITITLPKTDEKFNYVAIKEKKESIPKKALLRQGTNIEKYLQKNQIHLPIKIENQQGN